MTLQQLRVLVAVVEEGSFTRGAQAVYMTQSAASQHVRSLEQALGVVLLERTGSAVLPTSAGSGLVRYAQEILRTVLGVLRVHKWGCLALLRLLIFLVELHHAAAFVPFNCVPTKNPAGFFSESRRASSRTSAMSAGRIGSTARVDTLTLRPPTS